MRPGAHARQARDRALRSRTGGAVDRDGDGRRAGGDGRRRVGHRRALDGRHEHRDRSALRGDVPGALCRPRPVRPEGQRHSFSRLSLGARRSGMAGTPRRGARRLGGPGVPRGSRRRVGPGGRRRRGLPRLVRLAHAAQPQPGCRPHVVPDRDGPRRWRRPGGRARADSDHPAAALPGPGHYAATRLRDAELVELPELRGVYTWVDDEAHRATMEATERFVSRLTRHAEPERVLATMLFTDIVGSTELAARIGDSAWRDLLRRHHAIVRRELARYQGGSSTRPATGSSPRSTVQPAPSALPRRFATRCSHSRSRSARGSTPGSAR